MGKNSFSGMDMECVLQTSSAYDSDCICLYRFHLLRFIAFKRVKQFSSILFFILILLYSRVRSEAASLQHDSFQVGRRFGP